MKRHKKLRTLDSLLVHEGISMSVRDQRRFPQMLVHSLITVIGGCSTMLCFQGFYQFPCNAAKLILMFVCYSLLMQALRRISPRAAFSGVLLSFISIPLILLWKRDAAVVGIQTVYRVMTQTALHEQVHYSYYAVVGEWSEFDCVRFLFAITSFAVAVLLEYSDVLLSSRHTGRSGLFTRFLVTFPFLECGLFFGLETYPAAVFALIGFWLASLALVQQRVKRQNRGSRQSVFAVRKEKRFITHEISALYLLVLTAVLGGFTAAVTANFSRSREMNEKRDALLDYYHTLSISDITGLFQKIPSKLGLHLDEETIELDEIDRLNFNGAPALYVTVSTANLEQDFYMRGLVRADYTGSGWSMPTAAYRKGRALFQELSDAGRMPQTVFISDQVEQLTDLTGKYRVVNCTVQAVNREHVNYLPYQAVCKAGTKYRYDSQISLESTQNYDFWVLKDFGFDWETSPEQAASSPDALVKQYEQFVRESYLSVPDTVAMDAIEQQFSAYLYSTEHVALKNNGLSLDRMLEIIRDFLWETCEYDTAPGKTPGGVDFVYYFLNYNRRGFCSHYATAAVLLCRMCGIPARYCQGYVLTQQNYTEAVGAEDHLFTVPDEQAHAWAEIYLDGFGWQPYEFTESVADTWHASAPQMTETTQSTDAVTTTATSQTSFSSSAASTSQTTSTTGTAQQSTDGSGTDTDGHPAGETGAWRKPVLITICCAAALLLLILLCRAYHAAVVRRRTAAMHQRDANAAAVASYHFLVRLLGTQGIKQGTLSHEAFADAAEEHCTRCTALPEGRIQRAVEIAQEAVFRRDGTTAEAAAELCRTAELLAQMLCKHAKPLKRFFLRWVLHIVA